MSITLVQSAQNAVNAPTVSTPFASNNVAGNFLVVGVEMNVVSGTPVIVVNDSLNPTYTAACSLVMANNVAIQIFFLPNCAGGANTVTVSVTGLAVTTYKNLVIAEFIGVQHTSPEDGAGASASGSSTAPASGNFTVTVGDLVIGFASSQGSIAANSGTSLGTDTYSMLEYQTAASTTANTTFTASSGAWNAAGVAFKAGPPSPASINPTSDAQGYTGNVTVTGTAFDSAGTSTLSFSGTGITVNSYGTRNATTLTANITISAVAALTARDVTITNSDTQTGTLAAAFTVTSGTPSPASISPTSDEQGYTGNVTVTGTNFSTGTLSFSGTGITVNSYSVQNATTVTANITIAANATLSARDVIITNADTQTGTLAAAFTITSGAPSPSSISPTSSVQGYTGNVTVSGTNFSTGTLSFSGAGIVVNSYSVQNATTITANISISGSASLTARNVVVTNADTQTGTLVAVFTVTSGAVVSGIPLYVTNFRGPDQNPLLDGPIFESSGGGTPPTGLQTISNLCYSASIDTYVGEVHLELFETYTEVSTFPNDQYAEVTIEHLTGAGNSGIGPGVRHGETYLSGYCLLAVGALGQPSYLNIYSAFSPVTPGVLVTLNKGDIIRLEAVGNQISSFLNGVLLETVTNSTYASGGPALDIYAGTAIADASTSRFEAGIITNASTPYSVPDCRNYGNFPNAAEYINLTLLYDIPYVDSRSSGPPIDSRVDGPPFDCRVSPNIPSNSRTPGLYGPGE